jgi:hypothetical protein
MNYKIVELAGVEYIQRTDDDNTIWTIPKDLANADYQQYLAQLEADK